MNKSGTNRRLEKRLSALENAGATMKTTSIVARLREENAELRAENLSLQAENLALLAASWPTDAPPPSAALLEWSAGPAIKNPGEQAEVKSEECATLQISLDLSPGEDGAAGA